MTRGQCAGGKFGRQNGALRGGDSGDRRVRGKKTQARRQSALPKGGKPWQIGQGRPMETDNKRTPQAENRFREINR
jgi:hypothetical protein